MCQAAYWNIIDAGCPQYLDAGGAVPVLGIVEDQLVIRTTNGGGGVKPTLTCLMVAEAGSRDDLWTLGINCWDGGN